VSGDGRRLGAAVLGLVGASAAAMPAFLGAAVGVSGDVVSSMYERHRDLGTAQRENSYFFLYEADRRLRT